MSEQEITDAAQLEALFGRYPKPGAFALSSDGKSATFWRYDEQGNELVITAQAGDRMRYTERSVSVRTELVWDDETARYTHRKKHC